MPVKRPPSKRPRAQPLQQRDPCTWYAQQVVRGKIVAGSHVRAACARHLDDVKHAKARGLVWRIEQTHRVYAFFAGLRFGDGEHDGAPFFLEPSQCFIVGSLFGWYRADGYRRFRTAYIEIGKGNGKTPLAAGIGLYCMLADDEPGAEVYSAAVSRDQAGICFRDAKRFCESTPALLKRLVIGETNLANPRVGSYMRPVSSEGRSADGKRVHCALIDEVHEHPSATIVDKMRAGTKGRRNALIVEITNSGHDRNSVCYQHHEYSVQVLRAKPGERYHDNSWFAYICTLDACKQHARDGHYQPVEGCEHCDDWMRDPATWIKANPLLGVSIHPQYLEEQVREARGMPSKQNIVARLNFCTWTESVAAWISRDAWDAVQVDPDLDSLEGRQCYIGLDLSKKTDLTALALFFPDDAGGGDLWVEQYTPADTLREREDRDRVPYSKWVKAGLLTAVPGKSIDYGYIAKRLAWLHEHFEITALPFDRWKIDDLRRELDEEGIELPLVEFGQGFRDMGPAVDALEALILNGRIRIHRNPVLTWNASSAVLMQDPAENRKFAKHKATGRIDGIVAATQAVGCAMRPPEQEDTSSVYETRGIVELEI